MFHSVSVIPLFVLLFYHCSNLFYGKVFPFLLSFLLVMSTLFDFAAFFVYSMCVRIFFLTRFSHVSFDTQANTLMQQSFTVCVTASPTLSLPLLFLFSHDHVELLSLHLLHLYLLLLSLPGPVDRTDISPTSAIPSKCERLSPLFPLCH